MAPLDSETFKEDQEPKFHTQCKSLVVGVSLELCSHHVCSVYGKILMQQLTPCALKTKQKLEYLLKKMKN